MEIYIGCVTRLANYFLAGAALSVLAAACAAAQTPDVFNPAVTSQLKLHSSSGYHSKTDIQDRRHAATTFTETVTFTGTISEAESYKKWVELWELDGSCKHEKVKFPRKTQVGKIKVTTTSSNVGLFYELESKTATSDSFSGEIKARNCLKHTNLNLVAYTDLDISH